MIYLRKGQKLSDNSSVVVYDSTGYYNDGDSVICASAGSPDEPVCRYEAKFIAYGGLVYSVADPDALLEEIKKLDPATLFGKDSKQVAVDKIVDNIVPQKSVDPTTPEEVVPTDETVPQDTSVPTTTPEITLPTTPNNVSTTTPSFTDISTTTPSFNTSSSTPDLIDTSNNISTTTPVLDIPITTANTSTTTPPEILFSQESIATSSEAIVPEIPPLETITSTTTTL